MEGKDYTVTASKQVMPGLYSCKGFAVLPLNVAAGYSQKELTGSDGGTESSCSA